MPPPGVRSAQAAVPSHANLPSRESRDLASYMFAFIHAAFNLKSSQESTKLRRLSNMHPRTLRHGPEARSRRPWMVGRYFWFAAVGDSGRVIST